MKNVCKELICERIENPIISGSEILWYCPACREKLGISDNLLRPDGILPKFQYKCKICGKIIK